MQDTINRYPIWDRRVRANPQALYEKMRAEAPIYRAIGPVSGGAFWLFTRYDDCAAVLKDARFGKEYHKHVSNGQWSANSVQNDPFAIINRHMLNLDPPDHTRLRTLVHKAFTPRMVETLRPRIQAIADEYAAALVKAGNADFIEAYALPIPIIVIAELLGIPAADRDKFRDWSNTLLFSGDMHRVQAKLMEFMLYIGAMIDARQQDPRDDLISALVRAEENGDTLDRAELFSMVFLLLVAGHETTVNLIGNGLLALIQHPDQQAALRADPNLIKTAVEEIVRFNGPVDMPTLRWAFEDVAIGDVVIPRGEMVAPLLLGANRDPQHFANPNTFDITRQPNNHMGFGMGIHYCVGAPLARLEGAIALNTLLRHVAHVELTVPVNALEWSETLLIHGMKAMPVRVRPAR